MKKYKVSYYYGIQPQPLETPFETVEVECDEGMSKKEIISLGLSDLGAFPKSYHAFVYEMEDRNSIEFTIDVLNGLHEFMESELIVYLKYFCEYDKQALKDAVYYLKQK